MINKTKNMEKVNVLKDFSEILTDFIQSKSDAASVEASQLESLEKDFKEHIMSDLGEQYLLDLVEKMCLQSLNPQLCMWWSIIKFRLQQNRVNLIENIEDEKEASRSEDKLTEDLYQSLLLITRDSDAETPTRHDAAIFLGLE